MITEKHAGKLSREDLDELHNWLYWQECGLFDNLTLQGILNVYHASAEWEDFQGWLQEDEKLAIRAYKKAIKGHKIPEQA